MKPEGAEGAESDERCAVCGEGAAGADGAVCANMAAVCAEGAVRAEGAGKKKIYTKNHHVFEEPPRAEVRELPKNYEKIGSKFPSQVPINVLLQKLHFLA